MKIQAVQKILILTTDVMILIINDCGTDVRNGWHNMYIKIP